MLAAVMAVILVDLAGAAVLTGTGVLPPIDRGDLAAVVRSAQRRAMAAPPISSAPWAEEFGRNMADFELQNNGYKPYLVRTFHEFRSRYVNVTPRERVSYRPPVPPGVTPLVVGFFGGSVMFGVGQRDEHTIPSEFARVAEKNGVTIEVHNFGFPAWVSWQEQQYFEFLLGSGQPLDLAVFLDGFNEFDAQQTDFSLDPTHHSASVLASIVETFRHDRANDPSVLSGLEELASTYRRNSAIWRLTDRVLGRKASIPGKQDRSPVPLAQRTSAALAIYTRSLARIDDIATDHGVAVKYFWQPRAEGWSAEVTSRLPERVANLAAVFDGQRRYYDAVHTDEEGARQMAEAMWKEISTVVESRIAAKSRDIRD